MQKRNTSSELLRIISMAMIVLTHMAGHGGFFGRAEGLNGIFARFAFGGGKLWSCVMMLIGAYYVCQKGVHFRSLFHLFFCSAVIPLACVLLKPQQFGDARALAEAALQCFFPVSSVQYWFVTAYVCLLLLSPWLNLVVHRLSQRGYLALLAVTTLVFSLSFSLHLPSAFYFYNDLWWFVYLYFLMGYAVRFPPAVCKRPAVMMGAGVIGAVLCFALDLAIDSFVFSANGSPLMALTAVCLVLGFAQLPMRPNRIINRVARGSFLVYLLHDCQYLRHFWWFTLFQCNRWWTARWYPLAAVGIVCFFFALAIPLDAVCRWLEKQLLRLPILQRLARWADGLLVRQKAFDAAE